MKIFFIMLTMITALTAQAATVGQKAPDFSLPAQDGKTYKLSDYKNKLVVLEWYNHECPYVKKHYDSGNMQALQKKYRDKGVVWFSVVSSAAGKQGAVNAQQAKELRAKSKAKNTALLLDPSGKVGRAYDAKVTPHMYVIDKSGNLVYQGAIDDQPSTRKSSLKNAKNYVSQNLDNLLAGKPATVKQTKAYGCSVKY